MTPGDLQDFVERGRASEGVHDDDGASERCDGFFDPGGIKIERLGIDIDEDRHGTLVTENVGNGDERERGDDDFIAFADAERADAEMEGTGSGIHGDGLRHADVAREGLLELFHLGAEAQAGSVEYRADGGDIRFGDIGGGERDSHCGG